MVPLLSRLKRAHKLHFHTYNWTQYLVNMSGYNYTIQYDCDLQYVHQNILNTLKIESRECRLAQLVEQASHVQRLCPHCSGPGFDAGPGDHLMCVTPPLSHPVSCHLLQLYYQ